MIFASIRTHATKQVLGVSDGRSRPVRYFVCNADSILIGFEGSSLALTTSPLRDRDLEEYVVRADIVGEYGTAHPVSGT